jgi:hypothetical protein
MAAMSNNGNMPMSTAHDAGQEALISHLRTNISAEGTRNPLYILLYTLPNRLQPRERQAPILLPETRLYHQH